MSKSKCPHCNGGHASCKDSRPSPIHSVIRRRMYECDDCGYRFATEEKVVALEGGGVILTERHMAALFKREVEALLKRYFGDEDGNTRNTTPDRYRPGMGRIIGDVNRRKKKGSGEG